MQIQDYGSKGLRRIALPTLAAALASLAGCSIALIRPATPIANFGGTFTAVAGTQQRFNASSSTDRLSEPLTFAWNFGDGATATGVSPSHTYAMVGPVVVSLTVTDTSNMSSTVTEKGSIAAGVPMANAGGPYSGTVGAATTFNSGGSTDPQSETLTYAWNFGDGSTSAGISPSHVYAMPGTYAVSVNVTDTSDLKAASTTQATVAAAAPRASVGGPYAGTVGKSVSFSGSSSTDPQGEALTFAWSFGDGTTGTGLSPRHAYTMPGVYVASATATNTTNLSASALASVTIVAAAPSAVAGGPYAGAVGQSVGFKGDSSTDPQAETLNYAWNFGDDGTTVAGISPSHTYAMPGTYIVSLTVTDASNLSANTTTSATISPAPPYASPGGPYTSIAGQQITLSGSTSTDPQEQTLTYLWNFGDGSANGTGVSPSHTYAMPGTYIVSLTVTDASNLSAKTTTSATISPAAPYANPGGPYASIAEIPIQLSGSASTDPQDQTLTYLWNFGDGSANGTGVSPSHTYAMPGDYIVSLTVTDTGSLTAKATTTATIAAASSTKSRVMAGLRPISNSSVQLYAIGTNTAPASLPLLIAPSITGDDGGFYIAGLYTCPSPAAQVYLVATGGNPGLAIGTNNSSIALMAALGSCANLSASTAPITIDEVSTIEAVWPSAAYMSSNSLVGTADARNLSNAFLDSEKLASIVSGSPAYPGTVLAGQDLAIRSLANSLDSCVASAGDNYAGSPCSLLFAAATPTGGSAPADTASAARAIALNPSSSVSLLYYLAASKPPFEPALPSPPADWTLGLPHPTPTFLSSSLNSSTVFMGDSITNFWLLPTHNAGIPGQHASEMLTRFPSDVLGHGYARVVILAGTNDIWHPIAQSDQALQQIEAMAAMGKSAGIEVVLCALPPVTLNPIYWNEMEGVFNAALADFAMTNGYLMIDYFTPMIGHPEYLADGVHPNPAGYAVMESALSSVIQQ